MNARRSSRSPLYSGPTLTPGQVSMITGIPSSSLRRYAVQFADYLSPIARGRNRVYTESDVATLVQIRDLADSGIPLKDIPFQLKATVDTEQPEEPPQVSALAAIPRLIGEINRLNDEHQEQAEKIADLEQQMSDIKARLDRPWWQRIRRKPD